MESAVGVEVNEVTISIMEESPRPAKRQRTVPLEQDLLMPPDGLGEEQRLQAAVEPLDSDVAPNLDGQLDTDSATETLSYATNVLAVEAAALAAITSLYRTNSLAKQGLLTAVQAILQCHQDRGRLIVTGVGKSGYIGQKLVASCKSLGIPASFMHAAEAAHGDLGDIREVSFACHSLHSRAKSG